MKTVKRCLHLAGAVLVVSMALAAVPHNASAQGVALGQKHDWTPPGPPWKHDAPYPPGEPCPKGERPCPPGRLLKHDWTPPGQVNKDGVERVALQPSEFFVELVTAVSEASLPMPSPVPPSAQYALYAVWVQDTSAEATGLARALASRGNATARGEAVALVSALQALPYGDAQLAPATEAFNAYLDASADPFLQDPAPEFLVVHAFLGSLVEEALKFSDGNGAL